jgi:hypothetical protein
MARSILNVDATRRNHQETGMQRDGVASDDPARGSTAGDRRVRIYGRLGDSPRFSPSKTLGAAIVLLTVVMALIIAFVR